MTEVKEVEIVADDPVGDGFLRLRRLQLVNRYADDSVSPAYPCEFVERPIGLEAVAVVLYRQTGERIEVLLRRGLRPAIGFGCESVRDGLWQEEIVAGIVESSDVGASGLRARAAAEVKEEAGYDVALDGLDALGPGALPSPAMMPEMVHFFSVKITNQQPEPLEGDGSPMEHGATTRWLTLDDAIDACMDGRVRDMKTEIGLRRLRDYLNRKS